MPKVKSYNEQQEKITNLFKTALLNKGWSQGHLAKLCGFSNSQMSRIIRTPDKCCFSSLYITAKKLGIKELPII